MAKVGLADRLFLVAESPETPQHVACLGTCVIPEGARADFVSDLAARMRRVTTFAEPFNYRLKSPRLKAIAPKWEVLADNEIDIDYHFRHSALPSPGGERELGILISRLHSRPLDPGRPLWEFHLIEGLAGGRFAWYFKVHHSVIDGVGGSMRAQQMLSTDPASTEVRPLWSIGPTPRSAQAKPRQKPNFRERLSEICALGRVARQLFVESRRRSDPHIAPPFTAPKSVLNSRIGRQRRIATQTFDFERIRAVAEAGGVTINDVFIAICAGGLRSYLSELDQLPRDSLVAGTPVSVRVAGDETTGNAFSMVLVKMYTEYADPVERLRAISKSSTAAKTRLHEMPRGAIELFPSLFMGPFVVQNLIGLGGKVSPPYNVSISNVPGVKDKQYLCGAELEAMYPIALLYHGVGLFIALFTGSGRLGIGFTGDRDALPHLQRLAVYTGDALADLETVLRVNAVAR